MDIPDTTNYLIAGYAVIFVVLSIYLASFFIRNRSLQQDLETLQELEKKGQ
jgi:hypothetical protein